MFVVEKNYPVNNHMFKIDIENTRTRCEICSKLIIKTPELFFYCWLWTCICLLGSYLYFHCLDDFHYLDHFHFLDDLHKNWNLVYIRKLASGSVTYRFPYVIRYNDARGWGISLMIFWNYYSGIAIWFTYSYFIVDGKRSFMN